MALSPNELNSIFGEDRVSMIIDQIDMQLRSNVVRFGRFDPHGDSRVSYVMTDFSEAERNEVSKRYMEVGWKEVVISQDERRDNVFHILFVAE
ncbi:MAG: hypothetical protein WC284_09675 [Candidimonas sp.]